MTDSGIRFYSDQHKESVLRVRSRFLALTEELKSIPHLKLPINVDVEKLRQEITQIDTWEKNYIESEFWNSEAREYHASHNLGRTLIEYKPDSRFMYDTNFESRAKDELSFTKDGRLKYFVTDLGVKMPYAIQLVKSISNYPKRCRIMKIGPEFKISWHCHHGSKAKTFPYYLGVVQIPIFTNDKCRYGIRSKNWDYKKDEFFETYRPGEAWLFNSYHEHCVDNGGSTDRITLFVTYDLDYEDFLLFLEPIVKDYSGPRVRC